MVGVRLARWATQAGRRPPRSADDASARSAWGPEAPVGPAADLPSLTRPASVQSMRLCAAISRSGTAGAR